MSKHSKYEDFLKQKLFTLQTTHSQEVQEVFPNLVRTDDEELNGITDPKSLKMSVIPFMILKALQEATARIQTLESKVKTLEGG